MGKKINMAQDHQPLQLRGKVKNHERDIFFHKFKEQDKQGKVGIVGTMEQQQAQQYHKQISISNRTIFIFRFNFQF